ncbi:MAG: GldG family protein [Treponema sp.]|jgi:gliding-associated putative ABC transporter substrate-binding component GldG|nr:GldG family protein [Treponema sp.]
MNRNQARVLALLSVTAFTLVFLIVSRHWVRLDLTKNKAYTISEASRNLYKEISDQVRITYFVSDKLKQTYPTPGEIADLIGEYAAHSRGKIRFIQKDPAKAEILKEIEELGIFPQQIQVTEKNEITVATVYSGILIEYLDREAVIPVVFSLDTLEYDLSSRIRSLIRNVDREIGVIVGDAYKQWNSEYGLLHRELFLSGFKIRLINPGEEIPSSLPVLFILGGAEDLEMEHLYFIDRYITGGGNAFFALDGVYVDRRSLETRAVEDKGLLAMLANYGVVVRRSLVLDRTALNLRYQMQSGSGTFVQFVRYPHWIGVQSQGSNKNHPVTARFQGVDLYWASPLELATPPGITGDVLFFSTVHAWLQNDRFVTNPNLIYQFEEEADGTRGAKILAVSLSGIFSGVFEEENPVRKKPSRLIVVGDADFAGNLMQINRGEEKNLDFLIRAAEWLSNDEDIVAIRGRQGPAQRLDRITDTEKRDKAMAFSRTINTIVVPIGVILLGLFIGWRRKTKTANEKGAPVDI